MGVKLLTFTSFKTGKRNIQSHMQEVAKV